jgi:hypothetical protein
VALEVDTNWRPSDHEPSDAGSAAASGVRPGPTSTDRERDPQARLVLAGVIAVAVYACWRVTLGIDFGDGGHAVALAVRMAQGDVPFADEMNIQALGSVLAVPFTWLWTQVVGLDGVVLASRFWYLLVASGAGYLSYRALRTALRPVAAATMVAVALIPSPYNLLLVSYNTMPALGMVVATSAGFAAIRTHSARWAVVSGLGLSLAVVSHPVMIPAGVIFAVTVAWRARDRAVVRALAVTILGAAVLVIGWVVVVPGLSEALETYRASVDYQAPRLPPRSRLEWYLRVYRDTVLSLEYLPMWILVVTAAVVRPVRLRALALAGIPLAAAFPSFWLLANDRHQSVGASSGSYATIVVGALLIPGVVWVRRTRDRDLGLLLLLTVPVAVVTTPLIAMTTSAAPHFGATVAPLAPLLGVLMLIVLTAAGQAWPSSARPLMVAAGAVVLFLAVQSLYTFRNGAPWDMTATVSSGPNAGLRTTPGYAQLDGNLDDTLARWVCPGESILVQGSPSAYLFVDARMDTSILWLGDFGSANQATVDWFERSGREPDVAFVVDGYVRANGGWDEMVARDPLVAHLAATSEPDVLDGSLHVLRRQPPSCPLPTS